METGLIAVPSLFVKNLMSRQINLVTVLPSTPITEAARLMREHHVGDVIAIEEQEPGKNIPIGIITDRDIIVETSGQGVSVEPLTVADIMVPFVETAKVSDDVFEIIKKMRKTGVGRLPIIDEDKRLVAIVTAKHLLQTLAQGIYDLAGLSEQQQKNERQQRH